MTASAALLVGSEDGDESEVREEKGDAVEGIRAVRVVPARPVVVVDLWLVVRLALPSPAAAALCCCHAGTLHLLAFSATGAGWAGGRAFSVFPLPIA